MREVPTALASHLAEGTTTLCRCWTLVRRDGVRLGFTDHDRDLLLDGTVHAAGSGLEAAEATAELGFAVSGGDVAGALSADAISEADILAGRYDDATVETWLVNWSDPAQRFLLSSASVGEIRREDEAFVAELRGPTHRYDEPRGRVFRAACSADLGDAQCRVDLSVPAFRASGTVAATHGALGLATADLGGFAGGWFTAGRLRWTAGANAGSDVEIRDHRAAGGGAEIDLWQRAPFAIAPGDGFAVTAGCDKRLATCAAKFANVPNFRGCPHMPGNDFVVKVARSGSAPFDGGSLFR